MEVGSRNAEAGIKCNWLLDLKFPHRLSTLCVIFYVFPPGPRLLFALRLSPWGLRLSLFSAFQLADIFNHLHYTFCPLPSTIDL